MSDDEDWVKAAITDDSVVVELLVRLHHSTPPPSKKYSNLAFPLEWSARQLRSKPIPHLSKKKKPTPRASPTTPLSWSGATSVSDGSATAAPAADSFEDSSLSSLKRLDAARSKVTVTNETTTNKRTRKKKTLAELKEEEILLVKERRHLKRELAMLRVNVETQKATNESLKRLKLDLESQPAVESVATIKSIEANPDPTQQKESPSDLIRPILPPEVTTDDDQENHEPNISSQPNQENQFELPDLNLPLDDNFNS